jgi:superfamily II DNA or RNA helicase
MSSNFSVGSLVRVRDREWVVLPDSTPELLLLRPLGGTETEVAGVYTALEPVEPASFALPDPAQAGDFISARLLRDAVRLGFRSSAGPFRSFARINVEPRPYQLVPLLMALKQDPVRLLIADDVGIGKTIEALLIVRELLDRGEIMRMAILCPPQLAEQWQAELADKFHIDAELVLSSTATRLERGMRLGETVFQHFPFTVVSTDFIKSERRRDDFLRTAPELVIVDEAHTVAAAMDTRSRKHQRFELVKQLSQNPDRHLILVTATPHSGKEDTFRSLLSLLNPDFADLPDDLTGKANEANRRTLAQYFVQRRRGDIKSYADADTFFPERVPVEMAYQLTPDYRKLFERVLRYARETVRVPGMSDYKQRVRWWSALALLRSLASSPAAAASTLRNRAATAQAETPEDVDEIGRRTVLDLMDDEAAEGIDVTPGSDIYEEDGEARSEKRRLQAMARQAEALKGEGDAKLTRAIKLVKELIAEGYNPILFCRFIPTVEYVTEALRGALRGVEVTGITGQLHPTEREQRVRLLGESPKRVLVSTDAMSEGINLQEYFNAVVHYDLSWNPTRHEQREGRVDRYKQASPTIKVVTYFGTDNQIDGIVLDVLLRKHKTIRNSLGISVPLPGDASQIVEALMEGLILREDTGLSTQQALPGFEELLQPNQQQLLRDWDDAAQREKRSQTMFAQRTIKVNEVMQELQAARTVVGSGASVRRFLLDAVRMYGGAASANGSVAVDIREAPRALRETLAREQFQARFELPVTGDEMYLTRTHPLVEGLATYVMDTALDPEEQTPARRTGAIRTREVATRTTLLLLRFRYHIITKLPEGEQQLLAEDSRLLAFTGAPEQAVWLANDAAEALLDVEPAANIAAAQAQNFVGKVIEGFEHIAPHLDEVAHQHGAELLDAHRRVRSASRRKGVQYSVEPQLPPDVLGIFVFLPA